MGAICASRRQWIAFLVALALAMLIQHHVGADERIKTGVVVGVEEPSAPEAATSLMFSPTCGEDTWRQLCGDWWWECQFIGSYCPA